MRSVGGDVGAAPTSETAACAAAWGDARRDRAATLAALYAIEAAQPALSETKRDGLVERYGAAPGTDATRYFDVHAVLDHDHAAHGRRELEAIMQPADEGRLLTEAERVLQANWQLLDGVQARASLESPARDQQQPPVRELDALSLAGQAAGMRPEAAASKSARGIPSGLSRRMRGWPPPNCRI